MKQTTASLLLIVSSLMAAGCSTASDTASALPTVPSAPLMTENFSGTVQVGLSDAHPFTVTSSGFQVTLDLTSAGPPATIFMGFGVGAWDGTTCTLLSGGFNNVQAGATPQLSGSINAGQYCVMVYDIGNMTAPVTYTAVVAHY